MRAYFANGKWKRLEIHWNTVTVRNERERKKDDVDQTTEIPIKRINSQSPMPNVDLQSDDPRFHLSNFNSYRTEDYKCNAIPASK